MATETFEEELLRKKDPGSSQFGRTQKGLVQGSLANLKPGQVGPANTVNQLVPSSKMEIYKNRLMGMIKSPVGLRAMGLAPGLGLLGVGLTAASAVSGLFDTPDVPLEEKINAAEQNLGWAKRALNPYSDATEGNETIRSMHGKHSETGEWIVFPSIRSVGGKLTQLSEDEALKQAEKLEDFVTFGNEEKALEFSVGLSEEIGRRRSRVTNRGLLNG
jgi:hypothetical protein